MLGIQRNMWIFALAVVVIGCIGVAIIGLYAQQHLANIMVR